MKKRYLLSVLLVFGSLTGQAQAPALTAVYPNGGTDALDLVNYNVASFVIFFLQHHPYFS